MEGIAPKVHRIAVLTSGLSRGSNLRAMHDYFLLHSLPVEISFVVVTRRTAPVIDLCHQRSIPSSFISTKDMSLFENQLLGLVNDQQIELLVLAGFMKKLSATFIKGVGIPILNIHPALLPKHGGKGYYGIKVHKAVFEAGEQESGVTIHFVNSAYDQGQIWVQQSIDIRDCKSPDEIAAKVLKLEHQTYGQAVWKLLDS